MKSIIAMALSSVAFVGAVEASDSLTSAQFLTVQRASALPVVTGAADTFTGTVQIGTPFQSFPPGRVSGATVTFAAQARTAWHTHPLGQTLIVTAGLGLVQQEGQPAQVLRPGDVVTIPAHARHWHGASPGSALTHVAISEKLDGQSVSWQALVTEEEYRAAVVAAGLSVPFSAGHDGRAPESLGKPDTPLATVQPLTSLSPKQLSISVVASLVATSDMQQLNRALNQGLDHGLTVSEAKEILVQLYAYAGFPKSLNALGELQKVVLARAEQGKRDEPGRAPTPLEMTGNELLALGRANQAAISGGPVQGPVVEFAPIINLFLQSHLFGDIFARDNLDWQSRELATLGALAAMPGLELQLRSHVRAGMRVGLSMEQLRYLARHFTNIGMGEAAARIDAALGYVHAPASGG